MSNTITSEHPQLLVAWERRGRAFLDAIGPALSRSPRLLDGESGYTGVPGRAVFASALLHAALVMITAALIPIVLPALRSVSSFPPDTRVYTLTYLPAQSPGLDDSSGAERGSSGDAGGTTAYHPVQVIRVARGAARVPMVYQPPKLALPRANSGFMNLLVVPATPIVIPDVPHLELRSRTVAPAHVEVLPPPPPAETITGRRMHMTLPEPVSPPPSLAGISSRVRSIPTVDAESPAPDPVPTVAATDLRRMPDAGFLLSATPGNIVGAPPEARPGTLAMAPDGTGTTGAGGSGRGAGTGKGTGPGSGASGTGSGSGVAGSGYGADQLAHGGTAGGSGPGGTGAGNSPGPLGLTIRGGPAAQPGVIYLSSFAGPPQMSSGSRLNVSSNPQTPLGPRRKPAITIIASPRSGGGMATYGALGGQRVYTTYLDTPAGPVVLQYADTTGNEPGYDGDLVAPDALNLSLPKDLPRERVIVACTMNRNGVLNGFRVLESSDSNLTSRLVAALATWRFRPVLRRDTAIEVSAILGFFVGTQ